RHAIAFPKRPGQVFDGEGRVRIHFAITLRIGCFRGAQQVFVRFEFRSETKRLFLVHSVIAFCGSATSSRVSEMAIIGRKRMNKNSSVRNKPTLPNNVAQSQMVGKNIPHDDGTKSRCKLVMTITKRSSHIPRLMDNATRNSAMRLRRTRADQSACGISTFTSISSQKIQPYGPNARLVIMYCSKMSPLYHDIKAS